MKILKLIPAAGAVRPLIFVLALMGQKPASAAQGEASLLGELNADVEYNRREAEGSGGSASTHRTLRFAVQQYVLFPIGNKTDGTAAPGGKPYASTQTFGIGLGARIDRNHWSPQTGEQVDLAIHAAWMFRSWLVSVGYALFANESIESSGVDTKNRDGSGFIVGLRFTEWWENIGFGPSLTFDSIQFHRTQVGSLPESDRTTRRESLRPGLSVLFAF